MTHHPAALSARQNLLACLADSLSKVPGAVELRLFGSVADPARADGYADLDLQLTSTNPEQSQAYIIGHVHQAGELQLIYPVTQSPDEVVYTFQFAHESLYHKVDLGLHRLPPGAPPGSPPGSFICLWQQPAPPPAAAPFECDAFQPVPGTAAHFLAGELLSAVRYIKARKRGQYFTCWRFASAKVNALLRCRAWDGNPDHFSPTPLDTWQMAALDCAISPHERLDLHGLFDFHSPASMDRAAMELTRRIAATLHAGYPIDTDPLSSLTRRYLEFLALELCLDA